jgi:hypothetical protein
MLPRTKHALIEAVKTAVDRVVGQTWYLEVEKKTANWPNRPSGAVTTTNSPIESEKPTATMTTINLAESN